MAMQMLPLASSYLCSLDVEVGPVISLGDGPYGERRVVAILGGRVAGPGMTGVIVPGGADWQIARADGVLDIDAHYALLLDDDARVEVSSVGLRHGPAEAIDRLMRGDDVDPAAYFFRTFVRFQTGAARFAHLNRTMAVAVGARRAGRVELTLHRVL
jgi:Protein of unknown function (DUF3237)